MEPNLETCVADWAIDFPQTIRVFEQFQIDYCCGGRSLEYACRQRGLDPHVVLQRLRDVMREEDDAGR